MYKDEIFLEVFCHTNLTVKYVEKFNAEKKYVTRKHSSRMHTVRLHQPYGLQ